MKVLPLQKIKSSWPAILAALTLIVTVLGTSGLIVLAILLTALTTLASIGWFFATIKRKKRNAREIFSSTSNFFFLIALAIDHLGNVICGGFLNWLFCKEDSPFPFGVPGESVSEILGWNYLLDNLTEWGLNLRHDLDIIDPNHCEKARLKSVEKAENLIEKFKLYQDRLQTLEDTKAFLAKYN